MSQNAIFLDCSSKVATIKGADWPPLATNGAKNSLMQKNATTLFIFGVLYLSFVLFFFCSQGSTENQYLVIEWTHCLKLTITVIVTGSMLF